MIRQSTTRVARRKPTFGEVFTAFYTSIMGTAAMLDARQKDERRRDLKRQIEEVKADIERLTYTSKETIPDPTAKPPPGSIHNRHNGAWNLSRYQSGNVAEFFDSLGDVSTWEKVHPHSGTLKEWWKTSALPHIEDDIARRKSIDYDALQAQLSLEEADYSIAHRLPRDVQTQGGATKHFIYDLLNNAGLLHLRMNAGTLRHKLDRLSIHCSRPEKRAALEESLKRTDEEVQDPEQRALRDLIARNRAIYPESGFPRRRDAWIRISRHMNESIRAVLDSGRGSTQTDIQEDVRRRVVQICHIIMSCPIPPNVHTLSTLLLGFDRMGQHALANAVVVQLLYRSHLEPTEQTIVCLLKHYKEIGNLSRFHSIVQRCTAFDPKRSFKIRRKHVDELLEDSGSMRWAMRNNVTAHGDYVYERAWFSNTIINTILDGLLSFDCIHQAVQVFSHCWQRGVRMGADNLHQLLDQCLYALNEDAAYSILATVFKDPGYIWQNIDVTQRDAFVTRLQHLLDICGVNISAADSLSSNLSIADNNASMTRESRQEAIRTLSTRRRVDLTQCAIDDMRAALKAYKAPATDVAEENAKNSAAAQEGAEKMKTVILVPTSQTTRMARPPQSFFIGGPRLAPGPFETAQSASSMGRMYSVYGS